MSELLKKAAQDVADAWNVPGPSPVDHWDARTRLAVSWPTLANAVERLAELLEPDWEYNIQTTDYEGKSYISNWEWSLVTDGLEKDLADLVQWDKDVDTGYTRRLVRRRRAGKVEVVG